MDQENWKKLLEDLEANGVPVPTIQEQAIAQAEGEAAYLEEAEAAEAERRASREDTSVRDWVGDLTYDAMSSLPGETFSHPGVADFVRGSAEGTVDFVPLLGDLVGGEEAYDDFQKGDYLNAGIGGLATVVGMVPMAGDVLGKAVKKGGKSLSDMPEIPDFLKRVDDNIDDIPFSDERPPMIVHQNFHPTALGKYEGLDYRIPSPSGAISNAEDPVLNFGDGSFFFHKSKIDPRYREMWVYPNDAFTGRLPERQAFRQFDTTPLKESPAFREINDWDQVVENLGYYADDPDFASQLGDFDRLVKEGKVTPATSWDDYRIKLADAYDKEGLDPYMSGNTIYPGENLDVPFENRQKTVSKDFDIFRPDGSLKSPEEIPDWNHKNVRAEMDRIEAWLPGIEGVGGQKEIAAAARVPFQSLEEVQGFRDAGLFHGDSLKETVFAPANEKLDQLKDTIAGNTGIDIWDDAIQDASVNAVLREYARSKNLGRPVDVSGITDGEAILKRLQSPEASKAFDEYTGVLGSLPSDYMEWKPKGDMDLRMADAVAIPDANLLINGDVAAKELDRHLKNLGIDESQVFKYKTHAERKEIFKKLSHLHFAVGGGIGALLAMPEVIEYLENDEGDEKWML